MSALYSTQVQRIYERLADRGQTIGFAESCTGGLLSATLATQAGISKVFLGSVVCYHSNVKCDLLEVPRTLIQAIGEVSTPVALQMASGARRVLKTDWALAITGIAGPTGGTAEKPVGLVCFALVGPGISETRIEKFGQDGGPLPQREFVQSSAVALSLRWLAEVI